MTYRHSTIPEWEFLAAVAEGADCGILPDVNNVYVSAFNHGFDPVRYLDAVPPARVGQFHLAGYTDMGSYLFARGPGGDPPARVRRRLSGARAGGTGGNLSGRRPRHFHTRRRCCKPTRVSGNSGARFFSDRGLTSGCHPLWCARMAMVEHLTKLKQVWVDLNDFTVEGIPVYAHPDHAQYLERDLFVIDAIDDARSDTFSLEIPYGGRFVLREIS